MNSQIEYSFKTKTGICSVSSEKLVLQRQGALGKTANVIWGTSISRSLIIYGILAVFSLIFGVRQLINRSWVDGILFVVIASILFWNVIISRNNSATHLIERSCVKSIEAHSPKPPFTRGYFAIHFVQDGKERKRLVMLSGSMSGGGEEWSKALDVMKKSGWL